MTESAVLAPGVVVAETYEIDRLIGRGGMGEVWLARHLRLAGKQVAIKVLHVQGLLTTEALARFKREAEIAARLEHPNLVQVLDFNALPSGQPFLVMELLKGESLAARARRGAMAVGEVQQVVRQVGAALQAAHQAGVVHRDLKPENIFLVPTALGDTVKVLDFGISKLADSNTVQTTESVLIGTPLYMSPEQALGNNKDITPQSDLFSLGSICYELLTGQAPFLSPSVATVVFRIAYEQHQPLAQVRPDLLPNVLGAVEHALVKDVAGRTPSIEAFVDEFTGQPLAPRRGAGSAALYQSGMRVSESLLSGKTAAPATPQPLSQRAPPVPERREQPITSAPKTVSGTRLAIGLLVVVAALFLLVKALRPWADAQKAALAALDDAGWVAPDAGLVPVTVVVPAVDAVDAGAPEQPDAGVADAGRLPAVVDGRGVGLPVGSERDQQQLAQLTAMAAARQWEDLVDRRNRIGAMERSRAKADALLLLVRAMCERREDSLLRTAVSALKELSRSDLREAKRQCAVVWPDSANRDW